MDAYEKEGLDYMKLNYTLNYTVYTKNTVSLVVLLYLNNSHAEADAQDDANVCEEPALHTGSTALIKHTVKGINETGQKNQSYL